MPQAEKTVQVSAADITTVPAKISLYQAEILLQQEDDLVQVSAANITKGIIQVKAIKGEYADNSVGAGNSGSCGTITIGGKVTDKITQSPYYIHF